jgi:hypothetical protein
MAGSALAASELRARRPAVGPELVTDAAMMGVLVSVVAIVFGLIGLARRERSRGLALLGIASPFVVLLIEGVIKGKLRLF